MLLVGYGTHKGLFSTKPYWLIKNRQVELRDSYIVAVLDAKPTPAWSSISFIDWDKTRISLVPPFSFAVCKNRGGMPGLFHHVNDVSVYKGGSQSKELILQMCSSF